MKTMALSLRTAKEIIRDPLSLGFGLGFPLVLLLLLSAIQANIPVALFEIERLAPGIAVFGLSFITLFSATLISKDRGSSLLHRLYTTPLRPLDFILSYTLPIIPMAVTQSAITFIVAIILGLKPSFYLLLSLLFVIPISFLYISLGLLFGSILSDKAVGGVCGALLTNLSAWLSGVWFDLKLVGGVFEKIAHALPFVHAVELLQSILKGDFSSIIIPLIVVSSYSLVIFALAVFFFFRQMKKQ